MRSISVCACTYKRPEGLRRLLQSLASMRLPGPDCDIELVIVDNDSSASARPVVEELQASYPMPLRYAVEAASGVSFARNRAVQEARGEWIAFIDDDEWADSEWLLELWRMAADGELDGAFGPVIATFELTPPNWAVGNGAFESPRQPTGSVMDWRDCASNNVLFRRSLHQQVGGFDPEFAISGAEDSDFFYRCQLRGARFVWCDEAIVRESVPALRLTRKWLRRRSINSGRNYVRILARHDGATRALTAVFRGLLGLLGFGLLALLASASARNQAFNLQCRALAGYGKLTAFWAVRAGSYGARAVR